MGQHRIALMSPSSPLVHISPAFDMGHVARVHSGGLSADTTSGKEVNLALRSAEVSMES